MKKRVLSVLLIVVMLVGLVPNIASEVQAYSETDIAYPVENGNIYFDKTTGTITDCGIKVTSAIIPAIIDGVAVTTIGERAFYDCTQLKSVVIPDSVTTIGERAFAMCTNLTSVELSDGITSIAESTFYRCGSLASVVIPESVTTIGEDAFSTCDILASIEIGNGVTSIGGGAFYRTSYYNNADNWENGVLYIGEYLVEIEENFSGVCTVKDGTSVIADCAFYPRTSASSMTGIKIPDSVKVIGYRAFYDCDSLTSVVIGESVMITDDGVADIGDYAFYDCDALTSVVIGDAVTSIGESAFRSCDSLISAVLGNSLTIIGRDAFAYCTDMDVVLPDSLRSIAESAFYDCDGLTSVVIGDAVTGIGERAFYDCDGLTSVVIGDAVTGIGERAFYDCDGLTSVVIGDAVAGTGEYTFYSCDGLTSVVIGDSVTSIDVRAFAECYCLTNVVIPDSVTTLSNGAFQNCIKIKSIVIPNNVTTIGDFAFLNCRMMSVVIGESVTTIGKRAFTQGIDVGPSRVVILTPDCEIYDDESTLGSSTVTGIYGYMGSTAQTYAKKYGYEFFDITTICLHDNLEFTEAIEASCTTDGSIKYWRCCKCGEYFSDMQAQHEITYDQIRIPATGHSEVIDEGYAADCENAGLSEGKHCSVCGEILVAQSEIPALGHAYEAVVTEVTCTEGGFTTYTCERCSDSYVADEVKALGHNYEAVVSGGNCSEFGLTTYTCTNCNDSYIVYPYSEWSTEYPVGVNEELIETKEQYRYRSYDVVTSNEPLSDGYELMEEDWIKGSSGSVSYVTAWPDGFARGNNFYSVYNNPVPTAYKTDAAKRVIDNTSVAGYIYWHWCRNTYTAGPIDRGIEFYWTATYTTFHAFFSTTDPNTLYSDSWGCHQIANAACCKDTYWYVPLTVYKTDYTDYQKLYTYKEFGQWSDWSDETAELEGNYEHETRTLYRYVSGEYGDHVWDEGVNTIEPTCTEKGQITYTCTICGETDIAETEPVGHSYEAVVTAPTCTSGGVTTYTCANCNDSYTADETAPTGHKYHYTNNGANHTVGCDHCDYSVQQAHAFVNGTCICGAAENAEPIVDENLKFNMDISVGAEMVVNYNFMGSVVSSYTDFYLEVKKDVAGAQPVVTTFGVGEGHTPMASVIHPATGMPLLYNASYNGIAAKEMGDNFATTLYAIAADGKVYRSETVVSSIKNYLVSKINDANSIPEMKTMAVDMLNYGALAQIRFDYNAGMLANNTLTVAQAAYGTKGIPTAKDYYTVVGSGANVTANITVGSRVELSLSCIASGISDPSKVNCVIMDEEYKILANPEVTNIAGVMFYAKYDNVGAKEMRDLIRIMFYDGEKLISKITTWSVESYVAQTRVNPNATVQEINVANAMLTYGDSVAAYMSATTK